MERTYRIGLVSPYDYAYPGGANDHVHNLAAQFRRQGHYVRVIAPCSDTDAVSEPGFVPMGRPVPFPSRGSIARISVSVWNRPRIRELLAEERFDIIHLHEPYAGFVTFNVLRESEALNIGTFHAYPGSRLYRLGGTRVTRKYHDKLHGKIAVSPMAAGYINKHYPGTYEIIPNGIHLETFENHVTPIPEMHDGMINLLFLGRLEKRKGLRYALAAFSRLKWNWPNLRLVVVGPGQPDADSYRIISERNLQDVVMVGGVSDEDRVRYYKSADIYCAPATGGESFGVVLLEAMASGTPIVAAANEGYSTVIEHGVDGLLVPPKDDVALAEAIDSLLHDSQLRGRLAANGHRTAERYRWESVAGRVMDYYRSIVQREPALLG